MSSFIVLMDDWYSLAGPPVGGVEGLAGAGAAGTGAGIGGFGKGAGVGAGLGITGEGLGVGLPVAPEGPPKVDTGWRLGNSVGGAVNLGLGISGTGTETGGIGLRTTGEPREGGGVGGAPSAGGFFLVSSLTNSSILAILGPCPESSAINSI